MVMGAAAAAVDHGKDIIWRILQHSQVQSGQRTGC